MSAIDEDVRKTGGSVFLTEFGLCGPDGNPDSGNTVECEFVMDLADKHFHSWTYWDSGFFDGSGNVNWNIVRSFARAYPRAVAGIPKKMTFDLQTKKFRLEYVLVASIKAPTAIFLHLIQYQNGFSVATSSFLTYSFDVASRVLSVSPSSPLSIPTLSAFVEVNAN